jgi:ferritin-like metal-binding protein YciE
MKNPTLADLYLDQIRDMHSSERQIIKALPKMTAAAEHPELKAAFTKHLAETKGHVERLDLILEDLEKTQGRKVCEATLGLVKEGAELIEEYEKGEARDAGLICAAQKIEHYEIATYGCLRAWALLLGRDADIKHIDKTLNEEKKTDLALTELAVSTVNSEAVT